MFFIILIFLYGCQNPISYQSVMPSLEKQEQPVQSGCSVEGINKEKVNIEYVKVKEVL